MLQKQKYFKKRKNLEKEIFSRNGNGEIEI